MYSRLEEDELPSSPPRTRNGAPSTMSCVAAPCLRRCGSEDGCATQVGLGRAAMKTQIAAKITIQCLGDRLMDMFFTARDKSSHHRRRRRRTQRFRREDRRGKED